MILLDSKIIHMFNKYSYIKRGRNIIVEKIRCSLRSGRNLLRRYSNLFYKIINLKIRFSLEWSRNRYVLVLKDFRLSMDRVLLKWRINNLLRYKSCKKWSKIPNVRINFWEDSFSNLLSNVKEWHKNRGSCRIKGNC